MSEATRTANKKDLYNSIRGDISDPEHGKEYHYDDKIRNSEFAALSTAGSRCIDCLSDRITGSHGEPTINDLL